MTDWKCRMINNKNQIKWCFGIKKVGDNKECSNRVNYIIYKMSSEGYETKCWIQDLMEYVKKNGKFNNEDFNYS